MSKLVNACVFFNPTTCVKMTRTNTSTTYPPVYYSHFVHFYFPIGFVSFPILRRKINFVYILWRKEKLLGTSCATSECSAVVAHENIWIYIKIDCDCRNNNNINNNNNSNSNNNNSNNNNINNSNNMNKWKINTFCYAWMKINLLLFELLFL